MRLMRTAYAVSGPLRRTVERLRRGTTLGVRVLAQDADGCVVFVRHTYIGGWHLPGGGVDAGENLQDAARRELFEETAVVFDGPLQLFAVYANFHEFPNDHVALFLAKGVTPAQPRANREIAEVRWAEPLTPPDGATPATRARLTEVFAGAPVSAHWRATGQS